MNDTIQTLLSRRSTRKYKKDPIPQEVLSQILKAGTYAPTGMNKQSPIILAITNKQVRNALEKVNAQILGHRTKS